MFERKKCSRLLFIKKVGSSEIKLHEICIIRPEDSIKFDRENELTIDLYIRQHLFGLLKEKKV